MTAIVATGRARALVRGLKPRLHVRAAKLELRAASDAAPMPDGVCGIVQGIALVYNEVDDYGTRFRPGCLAKSRDAKLSAGKLNAFADHDKRTRTHVGLVRALEDLGNDVVMTAHIFDTEEGRKHKDYLEKVIAAGGEVGLSIGFRPRSGEWVDDKNLDGGGAYDFTEIELREISFTPCGAVPGAAVTGVRHEADADADPEEGESSVDDATLLRTTLLSILRELPEADARAAFDEVFPATTADAEASDTAGGDGLTPSTPADARSEGDGGTLATLEYRMNALRESYR